MHTTWLLRSTAVVLGVLPCAAADGKAVLWRPPGTITITDFDELQLANTITAGAGVIPVKVRTIDDIVSELGIKRVDLLKLNIEGAEHEVLGQVISVGVRPKVITLTYEGRGALRKAYAWTSRLRQAGYRFLGRRGWWFTYVHGV